MTKQEAGQIIREYICECGYPSEAMKRMHSVLNAIAAGHELEYVKECLYIGIGEVYLLAYLLNALGLIEHDCSIKHPWITDNGYKLYCALNIAEQYNYDFVTLMEDEKVEV